MEFLFSCILIPNGHWMRILYFTLLLILTIRSYAQDRVISGRLTDDSGEPLPGVTILVKGTTVGGVTDIDGFYSVSAPVGSILVFSYIGFETQEIIVTDNWPKERTDKSDHHSVEFERPSFPMGLISDSLANQEGVGVFTHSTKTYRSLSRLDINKIYKVSESKKQFVIKSWNDKSVRKGFGFQYSQVLGILKVTQLPQLQSIYAQGRPNTGAFIWSGPDANELFSWGPRVANLEFDGSSYQFDLNGRLVEVGLGNEVPAHLYSNNDFFNTGFLNTHDFLFSHSISRRGNVVAGVNWETNKSIIPNAGKDRLTVRADLEDIALGQNSKISLRSSYANAQGRLLSHGANLSRIIADALSAPTTFDNANGFSKQNAVNNPISYETSTGQVRSFALGLANNPFGLISEAKDSDEMTDYFMALEYEGVIDQSNKNYWKINAKGSVGSQKLNSRFGLPVDYAGSPSGFLVVRKDKKNQYDMRVTPTYQFNGSGYPSWGLTFVLDYHISSILRSFNRLDGESFSLDSSFDINDANTVRTLSRSLDRNSHRIAQSAKVIYNNYTFNVGNSFYFSNTADQRRFTNFFPFVGLKTEIYAYPFNLLPKASYSRSIQESSLIYNDWAYLSTLQQSGDFRNINEISELFFTSSLNPEITSKLEFELETRFDFLYGLEMNFNYSYETINDFIAPNTRVDQFYLENVAKVANESFKLNFGYHGDSYWNNIQWNVSTRWVRNLPKVIETNSSGLIPLAGFTNAFAALAEGEPLGVIYGTSYDRDVNNKLVIGNDGYPIMSNELKPIANPNHDWELSFDGFFSWSALRFDVLLEYLHGGSIWNGTAAYLDYTGRSEKTGTLRETTNFVFEGVDRIGNSNTTPVDFLDPNQDVLQSRWVRYGAEGVTEEYIEDISSFRLAELILGYQVPIPQSALVKELSFYLIGRNLIQITPYSGVDPQSSLFGYSLGRGLDMFNMPSTRSYQFKMTIKL